jgi:hypothetical protein
MEGAMQKLKWVPGILAVLAMGAEVALNLFGSNIHVALWLVVVFLAIQVAILGLELQSIQNARPQLEVYDVPYEDERPLITAINGKPTGHVTTIQCFHIRFADNPKLRVEQSTARKVFADLTFYTASGKRLIGPIHGRWGDTEQPASRSLFTPNRDLLSVDLESSGLPRELNLAIKHLDDDVIYAFNNDSYSFSGWRHPNFRMTQKKIFIHIELSGENVDDYDVWVLLRPDLKRERITLTDPLDLPEEGAEK